MKTDAAFERRLVAYVLAEPCPTCRAAPGDDCDAPDRDAWADARMRPGATRDDTRRSRQHPPRAAAGARAMRADLDRTGASP